MIAKIHNSLKFNYQAYKPKPYYNLNPNSTNKSQLNAERKAHIYFSLY